MTTQTFSETRFANEGDTYAATWVGTPHTFTTWEGDALEGVVGSFDGWHAIVEFPNGTHARVLLSELAR